MKRYFSQSEERREPGAVHALGTGRILVYGQGPEWMQMIGAPYSCPTMASLRFSDDGALFAVSERTEGASDRVHTVSKKQSSRNTRENCGVFRDVACRDRHVILRRWELDAPVTLHLTSDFPIADMTAMMDALFCDLAFAVSVPRNAPVHYDCPVGTPSTMVIGIRCDGGSCTAKPIDGGVALTLSGTGTIYVCGGEHFPAAHAALCGAMRAEFAEYLSRQRAADSDYLAACQKNRIACRREPPADAEDVLSAIEDVLFAVRAQQSEQGGVMAGHACHLAYIREQYGILRGLLSMGDLAGAKAILRYCLDEEMRAGMLHSAHGMGAVTDLIHENENAGITAYQVLLCTEYLRFTGDIGFFEECLGMCGRAMQRAIGELAGGMMPFGGDETYIAGGSLSAYGHLPRTVIEQGSLEATALFIAAAEQLERVCRRYRLPIPIPAEQLYECRAAAELAFDENFARRGGYTVNAPKREALCSQPLYRHGVCCFCGTFGWLRGVSRGCYVCAACAGKEVTPDDTEYRLASVCLTLPYAGSALIGKPALTKTVRKMLSDFRKTGRMQDKQPCGCDLGLLLYAAAVTGEDASDLVTAALDIRDACGMWCGYCGHADRKPIPAEGRCRPWVNAVTMDCILTYLASDG